MNINSRRLHVLHIFSGDLWAGAEVMIFNLLNKLKEAPELRISAISLNDGILSCKLREAGIETYVISEKENSFFSIFNLAKSLLKKDKIDVIHSHRYKENLLALLIAKSHGVKKLVTTVHGLSELPMTARKPLKTRIHHFMLKNYFSDVVAVSQDIREELINSHRFDHGMVSAIHNGISLPLTARSPKVAKQEVFHIGTVGRMEPVKDFNLFLDIAAEIRKSIKNVRFSILGDGSQRQHLLDRSKSLGLSDSLEFISLVRDPFPYYHSIDIYLNTSVHEGIPMSILEAMSCGKPVVAPRVGGIPEIISHGEDGFLVEGREVKRFAQHCLKLLSDKDMMTYISKNATGKVRRCFSNSRMAESYRYLYEHDSSILSASTDRPLS